jgi:hypothetical protein
LYTEKKEKTKWRNKLKKRAKEEEGELLLDRRYGTSKCDVIMVFFSFLSFFEKKEMGPPFIFFYGSGMNERVSLFFVFSLSFVVSPLGKRPGSRVGNK